MFFQTSLLTGATQAPTATGEAQLTVENQNSAELTTENQGNAEITIENQDGTTVSTETGDANNTENTTSEVAIDPNSLGYGTKTMTTGVSVLYGVYAVVCLGLIVLILSQKKRSASFGNGMSGGTTYWDKNKGRSMEGKMDLYTKWGIGIFMALTFIITLI